MAALPAARPPAAGTAPSLGGFAANAELFDASARELLAGSSQPDAPELVGPDRLARGARRTAGAADVQPARGVAAPLPLPQRRTEARAGGAGRLRQPAADPTSAPDGAADEDRLVEEFTDAELIDDRDGEYRSQFDRCERAGS